eukprot:Ihof_evm4s610 gene=Ihof_evmTU4s610
MSSEDYNFPTRNYDDESVMSVPVFSQGQSISPYAQSYANEYITAIGNQNDGGDYLFPDQANQKRSMFEKLGVRTGIAYLAGSAMGGAWGIAEGLRNPQVVTRRLKINSVLNSITRRGPFLGNFGAVLALMYTFADEGLIRARGGQDDVINTVAAGALTGALFKAT